MKINNELQTLNKELTKANQEQQRSNNMLSEANIIKEEYIGRFRSLFNISDKLEAYRRMLNKGYLRKTEGFIKH